MIGAELEADLEAVVARPGEDHRLGAHGLGYRHAEQPDRAGAGHHDAFAGHEAAELGQAVHGGAGGDDERRLFVRHRVRNGHERVDVVDLVFAEAAVGGEAVGAVALVDVAVVQAVVVAGRVHAFAAALALAAAGVDFHRHPLADPVFVDAGAERRHGAHIFVAGREVLVERQPTLDGCRRAVIDDLEIGGADRHRVDAHQHFGPLGHRHRLFCSDSWPGSPSTHAFMVSGTGKFGSVFTPAGAYILQSPLNLSHTVRC